MNLKKIFNNIELGISIATFVVILVMIFCQVMLRFIFRSSIPFVEEISPYLLVWLAYFAAGYTTKLNGHVRVDSVMSLYPEKIRKYVDVFGNILWILTSALLVYFGTAYTAKLVQLGSHAHTLEWVKMWMVYIAIPIGNILIIIRLIGQTIDLICKMKPGKEKKEENL